MIINRFIHIIIGFVLFLPIYSTVYAETPFIADELIYDSNTQEIIANGNVEIDSDQGYFYLEKLIYDIDSETITVEGNVRGQTSSGERVISDFAFLNPTTQQLILLNARVLFLSNLQIVASRINESNDATYAENVRVTSCEVCVINPVPIWEINADQVYRDKEQSKIYFNKATFEMFGFPVLYLPKMRIPDIGVERMSGFLRPEIIISDLFDSGIRIPYFQIIDDHSDLLLSSYLTTAEVYNFEMRYRNNLKGGKLQLDGAYSFNDGEDEYGRYYLQSEFTGNLSEQIELYAIYTINSDNDFAPSFSYENAEKNQLQLTHTNNNQDLSLNFIEYRPTSIALEDDNNPLVIPRLKVRSNQQIGLGSAVFSDFDIMGLVNDDADDVFRATAILGVDDVYALPFGVTLKTRFAGRAQGYATGEFDDEVETSTRISPVASLDATLPLSKTHTNGSSLLVPRAQVIWSDNYESGADITNSDALFYEHDYITLFSENQYSGQDRLESGLRMNLGASYVYDSNFGSSVDLGFGKVIRLTPDDSLDEFDGAADNDEEWVGYINYVSSQDYSLYARASWNDSFVISRAEIGIDYTHDDYSFSFEGVHLEAEPEIGYDDIQQEISMDGFYHFAPNWQADFSWRYDLINTLPLEGSISLTYGNECIEASAGFVQDFNRGEGIDDETTYEFSVSFIGLGQAPTRDWPRRTCNALGILN